MSTLVWVNNPGKSIVVVVVVAGVVG